MAKWIVSLKRVRSAEAFGQKAFNLSRLMRWGFKLPVTRVVPVAAFEKAIRKIPEVRQIASLWPDNPQDLFQTLAKISNQLEGLPLETDFKQELDALVSEWQALGVDEVAVRSSALSEDQGHFSFAGQYKTILKVRLDREALWEAIKTVWASVFDRRVWEYCQKNDLPAPRLKMGVIVQAMVAAEYAGVAFSVDPNRPEKELCVIEYVKGQGEALVSGEETPRHLELNRLDLAKSADLKLPFDNVSLLVEEVLRLERLMGQPVDVEWAYADHQFYFLQVRPITTLQNMVIWTRENVGEVIPDVVTPFTWSILEPITNRAYHFFLKRNGIKSGFETLFTLYQGKVYFNHNAYQKMVSSFYLSHYLIPGQSVWLNGLKTLKFSGTLLRLFAFSNMLPGKIKRVIKKQEREFKRLRHLRKDRQPFKTIQRAVRMLKELMKIHVSVTILAELYYQLLDKFCHEALPESEVDASKLLQGIGQVESLKPTLALWEIAHWIQENERYRHVFLTTETKALIAWWENLPASDILKKELRLFLDSFGHAALHEFEISYPRWGEDYEYIFNTLKQYVKADSGYAAINKQYQQTERERRMLVEKISNHLERQGLRTKKALFRHLLSKAEYFSFHRELLKQKILKWLALLRNELLLSGGQFFENEEDVFYLKLEEFRDLVSGKLSGEEAEFLILLRKDEREKALRFRHPFKLKQIGDKWIPVAEETAQGAQMSGLPCSSGIVEGRACVVLDAERQSDQLLNGDILVTRATNPGWTPLMALASGVVTEIGGALSHGAIIAREFHIPMVAAVPNATQKIRTGQWIRVDGQKGTVEILKEAVQ